MLRDSCRPTSGEAKRDPLDYRGALHRILKLVDYERMSPTPSFAQEAHHQARYDLRRIGALLQRLERPHEKTPTVHIAGSKGKGSTAALCASVLHQHGFCTGLYTSPHLHTFRERISVDGASVSEASFAALVEKIWEPMEEVGSDPCYGRVTLFELLTAMALVHFNDEHTDVNVLEVGLGGRLDATNVVIPRVSVVTSISLDHTQILGNTLEHIATEKAGIIKPGVPVISAPQPPSVMEVIRSVCHDRGTTLVEVGRDVLWEGGAPHIPHGARAASGQRLKIQGRQGTYDLWMPLLGDYQMENAATAVATLEVLKEQGYEVSYQALEKGFACVDWPCRMEVLAASKFGPLVVADGAHNPYSVARLRDSLPLYFDYDKVILILGVSQDKNLTEIVGELAKMAPRVIATSSRHLRAALPSALAGAFRDHGIKATEVAQADHALQAALDEANDGDLVLATGSLFLAAEVREAMKGIPPELYPEFGVV